MYDYILKGGTIVDGTGSPAYTADLAIKDGIIAVISNDISDDGAEVIDVTGLTVSPGFIDIHSHSDTSFLKDDRCESKIFQGVTTEVAGQCGYTIYPCPSENLEILRGLAGEELAPYASASFSDFMAKAKSLNKKMGTNLASLIGHGALRAGVMGYENRKATGTELLEMQQLLDRDMQAGAFGLSLGLGYTPGISSDQEELNALGAVVAKYDGMVAAHMRDQGANTPRSLEEMYEINRSSGAHVHIAHFKAGGKANWGRAPEFVAHVARAREEGIDVTVDVYPYTAASSGITNSFPKWSIQGGIDKAVERLQGDESERLMAELAEAFADQQDGESLYIVTTRGDYPPADGKTIWQLSQELGLSMAETIAKVAIATQGKASCIAFAMSEADVDYMLSQNEFAVGSDGSSLPLSEEENDGKPHPRNFGTFPRFLRLAREKNLCSKELAVHRISGLPAKMVGIGDRGVIAAGKVADITVFDHATITDRATYDNPFQKPEGIVHVFMAGKPAVIDGVQTEHRLGRFLLKNDH